MDKDSSVPPGFLVEWSKLQQFRLLSGWIQAAESPDALDEIKNAIGDTDKIGLLPKPPHLWHQPTVGKEKCRLRVVDLALNQSQTLETNI